MKTTAYRFFRFLYFLGQKVDFWRKSRRSVKVPNVTVISIGNLTAGGTGKTPITKLVTRIFNRNRLFVTVISRGYGRKSNQLLEVKPDMYSEQCGDEPLMIKRIIDHRNHVVVHANRVMAADFVRTKNLSDIILLDDGYQHYKLARDLDIVLLNVDLPHSAYRLLPLGQMRETFAGLKRGNIFLLISFLEASEANPRFDKFEQIIKRYKKSPSIFRVYKKPAKIMINSKGESYSAAAPKRVVLFSGLAQNQQMADSLKKVGYDIINQFSFNDHFNYSKQDIIQLIIKSAEYKCDYIVTSQKDWTKVEPILNQLDWGVLPFNYVDIGFIPLDLEMEDEASFEQKLLATVGK